MPVVNYEEVLSQAYALGVQVAAALDHCVSNDAYEDRSVVWILLDSLESLQKENNKLRSLNSIQVIVWEPKLPQPL